MTNGGGDDSEEDRDGEKRPRKKFPFGSVLSVLQSFRGDSSSLRVRGTWSVDARWMCGGRREFADLVEGFVEDAQGSAGLFVRGNGEAELGLGEGEKGGLVVNVDFEGLDGVPKCECFYFFGQVLGVALRNGLKLEGLNLNRALWKVMAGVGVGREDLYLIDGRGAQVADILAQIRNLGVDDDESFVGLFGGIRRMREGGEGEGAGVGERGAVTVKEAEEYAVRIRRAKFLQMSSQIQAIYCGLTNVVPASGLVLHSSEELAGLWK